MNLYILCIATIIANNWAVAYPGDDCGTQDCGCCGTQNCGTQNCGSQSCGTQNNCDNDLCDSGESLLEEGLRTTVAFRQYDITSDDFLCEPPNEKLRMRFDAAVPNLGNCIPPVKTILPPYYYFDDAKPELNYTIVVFDLDFPSPATPSLRSFLVSLYVNVNGSGLASGCQTSGDDVAPWVGPAAAPGSGPHRVVAVAFEQSCYIDTYDRNLALVSAIRINFDLEEFRSNYTLNLVAGNFWTFCIPDDYCNVCDRNKPYQLYRNQGLYTVPNNDNIYLRS